MHEAEVQYVCEGNGGRWYYITEMEKEYLGAEAPLVISVSDRWRQEDQAFKITLVGGQTKGYTGGGHSADKALAVQTWWPEFNPQNPQKSGRRELAPWSCPLTCRHILWPALTHHAYTEIIHFWKRIWSTNGIWADYTGQLCAGRAGSLSYVGTRGSLDSRIAWPMMPLFLILLQMVQETAIAFLELNTATFYYN